MVQLAGYDLRLGWPGAEDLIAVWGRSPYARRGEWAARHRGAGLLRIEDAFLRSLHPGRSGEAPLGLLLDQTGVHFDAAAASDLETLLATHPLEEPGLLERAETAIERLQAAHLSKYSATDPDLEPPPPGYVLVVDQTRGDASIRHGGAHAETFAEMLAAARAENPGRRIVIKTHPETRAGYRPGYFSAVPGAEFCTAPLSPWPLLAGARSVYTVSSQLGFEAILAGHRPQVFGQPFYAGWGLSEDRHPAPLPRRGRLLTREQIFAAAMILYPVWYDPYRDRLCELETVIDTLEAQSRAWREDHRGWIAHGMRLWKRPHLQKFFGAQGRRVRFTETPAGTGDTKARPMVWASKPLPAGATMRVEDGFLRSRGLGAELTPPLSLICDDLGIYYDPARESRLERLVAARPPLRPDQVQRARALIRTIRETGLSKYNLPGAVPELPKGHRILVPGQVEDDASIRLGAGAIATNLALLERVRRENPAAVVLYKPHPDVEAGLRPGMVARAELARLADAVLDKVDPAPLLEEVQEVWTMTSLLGFEALLRGLPVTTTGAPFYAGWGLTRDLGEIPARRKGTVSRDRLVHAALIDYPRYHDPVTGLPCPVEVAVERLADGNLPGHGPGNRALAKLQGLFASHAGLWR